MLNDTSTPSTAANTGIQPTAVESNIEAVPRRKPFSSKDAPSFNGYSVTEFVQLFEDYCSERAIPLDASIARIKGQCETNQVKDVIDDLYLMKYTTWGDFAAAMKEKWEELDPAQVRHTVAYLRNINISEDINADDLERFCNQWESTEMAMVQTGKSTTSELATILCDILPTRLLRIAVMNTELDRRLPGTMLSALPITNLRNEAKKRRSVEKVLCRPIDVVKKVTFENKQLGIIPHSVAAKNQLNPSPNGTLQTTTTTAAALNNVMEDLNAKFAALSMNLTAQLSSGINQMQQRTLAALPAMSYQYKRPASQGNVYEGGTQANYYPQPPQSGSINVMNAKTAGSSTRQYVQQRAGCFYCDEMGHNRRFCPKLAEDVRVGWCHEDSLSGRLHHGRAEERGPMVDTRMRGARSMRDLVCTTAQTTASIQRSSQPTQMPSAVVNTISMSIPEDTDDEITDDEKYIARVLAARVEKRKSKEAWKSDARDVLKKRSAKESKLPTAHIHKVEEVNWPPVVAEQMQVGEDFAITPGPHDATRAVERKPRAKTAQTWLQGQVAANADPENYLRNALTKAKLEVSVWDLLTHAPTLQDLMSRKMMVPIDRGAQGNDTLNVKVSSVKVASIGIDDRGDLTFMERSPRIEVRLGSSRSLIPALIDTGAEINVITSDLVKTAGLPMLPNPTMTMTSHTGHQKPFVGCCPEVPILIAGLTVYQNFLVLDEAEHRLVLGMPFMKYAKATFRYENDGHAYVTVHDEDGYPIEILASLPQTEEQQRLVTKLVKGKAMLA